MANNFFVIPDREGVTSYESLNRLDLKVTFSEQLKNNSNLNCLECYVVSDEAINAGDLCMITDPDGDYFTEVCAQTIFRQDSNIFYGKEGTRCLLFDVRKITATTNKALISENVLHLSVEEIQSLFKQRKLQYSVPNFYNE